MSDAPIPTPKPRTAYAVNNGFSQLLAEAQEVNTAAAAPSHADAMSNRGITAAFVAEQSALIVQAQHLMQQASTQRNAGDAATNQKSQKRAKLEEMLGQIQSAALQRDVLSGTEKAKDYYVGSNVAGANTAQLIVIGEGILNQLTHDDLPGVDPAEEALLQTAFNEWELEMQTQTQTKTGALEVQDELEALVDKVKRLKQGTQLAADAQYPWQIKANGPIRETFALPTDRPYRPRVSRAKV